MTDEPRRRGRPRVPAFEAAFAEPTSPLPDPGRIPDDQRVMLNDWWRARLDQIDLEHAERIEILRTVGEHPSPLFERQAREFGALGMGKALAARAMGISIHNMNTYYADAYEAGSASVVASVAANMLRIGMSITDPSNARVGMDILSRRGGAEWLPPVKKNEDVTNRPHDKSVIDASLLTEDERQQLRLMIERVKNGGAAEPPREDEAPLDESGGLGRLEQQD